MPGAGSRQYSDDWTVPTSIAIWGGTSPDRARLALALGRRIDPELLWLHVSGAAESSPESDGIATTAVRAGHLFLLDPSDLKPETGAGNLATWFARGDAAPGGMVLDLADFVRLPEFTRRLLEGRSAFSPTKVLVIANSNLLQPYYPKEEGGVRPFLEALNRIGVTGIYTDSSGLEPNSLDMNYLLRLQGERPGDSPGARVKCEQGAPPGTPGLFSVGEAHALTDLLKALERM